MQLLYIFLHDYKNFKHQGFCFSSEFVFSTSTSSIETVISIDTNTRFIENFFENPNITSVTAVIGQNGTGKSNLLEFIRTSLPSGVGGFETECVIVLKEEDEHTKQNQHLIYKTPRANVRISDNVGLFTIRELQNTRAQNGFHPLYSIDSLFNTNFINYSNIVDLKIPSSLNIIKLESEEESQSSSKFFNISTMAMLGQDQERYSNDARSKIDKVDAYRSRELARNIEFITSNYKDLLDFKLPDFLFVVIMDDDQKALESQNEFTWIFDIVDRYKAELENTTSKGPHLFNTLLRSVFFNLLRTDLKSSTLHFSSTYIKDVDGNTFEEFFRNMLLKMKTIEYESFEVAVLKDKSEKILRFIDFVYEYIIKKGDANVLIEDETILILPLSFTGMFSIQSFVELYFRTKDITDFLNFRWRSLSSGEQSMLTLISRFYSIRAELSDDYNDLIILFDEADLYFHPEWQRRIFSQLLQYIPNLFPNKKLQFILTANTPYLVSDLSASHVILLKKENDISVSIDPRTSSRKTFASNIHTLLSDDFYVSNFLGEFAKRKLEKIIRFINNPEDEPSLSHRKVRLTIDEIGESIIKNRIQDLYHEKFPINENRLELERKRLQLELDQIEEMLKQIKGEDD